MKIKASWFSNSQCLLSCSFPGEGEQPFILLWKGEKQVCTKFCLTYHPYCLAFGVLWHWVKRKGAGMYDSFWGQMIVLNGLTSTLVLNSVCMHSIVCLCEVASISVGTKEANSKCQEAWFCKYHEWQQIWSHLLHLTMHIAINMREYNQQQQQ